jgi:hypothetical protein
VLAWFYSTGHLPKRGRGDHHTGFGDLVHSIFQLLEGVADGAALRKRKKRATADYVLRTYSDTMQRRKKRGAPIADPLVCADCRWRLGASREEFYCTKLEIACETARSLGQACGPKGLLFER